MRQTQHKQVVKICWHESSMYVLSRETLWLLASKTLCFPQTLSCSTTLYICAGFGQVKVQEDLLRAKNL